MSHLEQLEGYWRDFVGNHLTILHSTNPAPEYNQADAYSTSERIYLETKGLLYDAKEKIPGRTESESIMDFSTYGAHRHANLPRIDLPTFSGQQESWESFRDMFRSLIHKEANLDDVQKLHYLRSLVKGEAKAAIDGLPLSHSSYSIAWAILVARFDNKRVLIRSHLAALLHIKPMKEESASEAQRILDELESHRGQLDTMGRPVSDWDDWFVTIADQVMDPITRRDWEKDVGIECQRSDYPSYALLKNFLQRRCALLQTLATCSTKQRTSSNFTTRPIGVHATTAKADAICSLCKTTHYLGHCDRFKVKSTNERRDFVEQTNACRNCLRTGHLARNCPSPSNCRHCGERHHSLLHEDIKKRAANSSLCNSPKRPHLTVAATTTLPSLEEATLTTTKLIRQVGEQAHPLHVNVSGVAGQPLDSAKIRATIHINIPGHRDPLSLQAYGLTRIGIRTPAKPVPLDIVNYSSALDLADPTFGKPSDIGLILGADAHSALVIPGTVPKGRLVAQKTRLGWTLAGTVVQSTHNETHHLTALCALTTSSSPSGHEELIELVKKFWAMEEVPRVNRESALDVACEHCFKNEHQRDEYGRYVVPMPLKPGARGLLGDSLSAARSALSSMHHRMTKDPELGSAYTEFMLEYVRLGHMKEVVGGNLANGGRDACYIPHHGIWQKCDQGRKLRVVFNASRPTASGHSLNDVQYAGPKLQTDIAVIVLRWRMRRIAFCADIKMMFRQIKILPAYVDLQRILWSPTSSEPARHYALQTVTYGEACSPYLSLRTLHQLASDEGHDFPEAVDAIHRELYVDDFLSGGDDVPSAKRRRNQLIKMLSTGGLVLKKWVSNSPDLLDDIPVEDRLRPTWLQFSTGGPVNELGIAWHPSQDRLRVSTPEISRSKAPLTKRIALTELARVFDPAGWLAPLTVMAKMLIQEFWRGQHEWDETLPPSLEQKWNLIRQDLSNVNEISIPRWLQSHANSYLELHVFADASRKAIAASLYCRVINPTNETTSVSLIWAKTKLTSIKSANAKVTRMTIPRLELRAALIAARLLQHVSTHLNINLSCCYAWSDSKIVLHWLKMSDPTGNALVDDYVAHIQEILPGVRWRHVPTDSNPADLASRGMRLTELHHSQLWWNGPSWLRGAMSKWPCEDSIAINDPSRSEDIHCLATRTEPSNDTFISRFSTLRALTHAVVRVQRLLIHHRDATTPRPLDPMTTSELHKAYLTCARICQTVSFTREITDLKAGRRVSSTSPLRSLSPFIDESGLLRVGGRLTHSELPYDEKHPVIICSSTHLAYLVIDWAHCRSLHGGYRVTYAFTLQRAWIIGGRRRIRSFMSNCVLCAKASARAGEQIMAPLPAVRVRRALAFSKTGVDYAGPFSVLRSKGRGVKTSKGYIAVFVCLVTKAIHLELAGDLTTQSFLGALTRFVGRRGCPNEIHSDNGTNFRGADAELQDLLHSAEIDWGLVKNRLAESGITWKFIPPGAPHFGGIWESCVKSTKIHLRRIAGPRNLTFEEFSTLLVDIERTLNCRPLVPLSGDPEDLEALTPAHLVIGRSLVSIPEPSRADTPIDYQTHWNLVKSLRDRFWTAWSREYLHTLQQRHKWIRPKVNLEINDMVVVLDTSLLKDNGRWPLGRVIKVFPGSDGCVRTATVRTASGIYDRPIVKLARLPTNDGYQEVIAEVATKSSSS